MPCNTFPPFNDTWRLPDLKEGPRLTLVMPLSEVIVEPPYGAVRLGPRKVSFGSNLRENTTSRSMRIYNMYSYVCVYIYIYIHLYMMYLCFLRFIYLPIYLFIYLCIYLFIHLCMCLFISTYIMCIGTLYKHITKPISHHPRSPRHTRCSAA